LLVKTCIDESPMMWWERAQTDGVKGLIRLLAFQAPFEHSARKRQITVSRRGCMMREKSILPESRIRAG